MTKKARILVVEDERVVATDIEESLEKLGYSVVGSAATGASAIRKAVETSPDLVLMDIKLKSGLDGVDTACELRDRLGIPVVYLTAYADSEILERAKRTSPSGYILKPFDERALRSAVEIALYRYPLEKELSDNEQRLISALRSVAEAVIMTQHDGRIALMNRAAEKLTGWRHNEASGKRVREVFHTVNRSTGNLMPDPVARVLREGVGLGLGDRRILISRHGAETWVRGSVAPLRGPEGDVVGATVLFRPGDTGRPADTDAANREGSQLETAGRLARGMTAELNRALAEIRESAACLRTSAGSSPETHDIVDRMVGTAERAAKLTEQWNDFTQPRAARPQLIELNRIVHNMEPLLECLAGPGVEVILALSSIPARVMADPRHIEEVILSLAAIASETMASGGKLTVETSDIRLLGEYARHHTNLKPGVYALISVGHTGTGGPSDREELCGRLPNVFSAAAAASGDIRVESEPGTLTTYEVYLPMAA